MLNSYNQDSYEALHCNDGRALNIDRVQINVFKVAKKWTKKSLKALRRRD